MNLVIFFLKIRFNHFSFAFKRVKIGWKIFLNVLYIFFWTALMIIKTGLIISPKESPQQFWERSDNYSLESCWFRGEMLNIRETVYWEAIFWSSWCLRLFMIRTFIVQNLISNQKRFNLFFQKRFFLSWWYFLVAIFKKSYFLQF